MNDFKRIVAENITKLRTSRGMTQAQLGEQLNYSDKSVSKWERGESLPDVYVLKTIADLYGVTVDWLLSEHDVEEAAPSSEEEEKPRRYSRRFVTLTVIAGIWALAVLIFVILWILGSVNWIIFIYAVPVTMITMLVLNSVWGTRTNNLYIISAMVWGILCSVYLAFLDRNWWQLFLIGLPAQIIIILAFSIRNRPDKR